MIANFSVYLAALAIIIISSRKVVSAGISIDLSGDNCGGDSLSQLKLDLSTFSTKDQLTLILPGGKTTTTSKVGPNPTESTATWDNLMAETDLVSGNESNNYMHGENGNGSSIDVMEFPGGVFASINNVEDGNVIQIGVDGDGTPFADVIYEFPPEIEPHQFENVTDRNLATLNRKNENTREFYSAYSFASRRMNDDIVSIDVMVVWTKKAECRNSKLSSSCSPTSTTSNNMIGRVNLAVQETNTAFQLSGVNTRLNLVHGYLDNSYVESSADAFWEALKDVTYENDGKLDDVHTKRAQYGADVVAMLIDDSQYCGKLDLRQ
jgi:hypothetical protein